MPDPGAFTAWGILGILAFAIVVLCGILYKIITKQAEMYASKDAVFVASLDRVTDKLSQSQKEMSGTLSEAMQDIKDTMVRLIRRLDEHMLLSKVADRIQQVSKNKGADLDDTVIERVVRSILSEQQKRDG